MAFCFVRMSCFKSKNLSLLYVWFRNKEDIWYVRLVAVTAVKTQLSVVTEMRANRGIADEVHMG